MNGDIAYIPLALMIGNVHLQLNLQCILNATCLARLSRNCEARKCKASTLRLVMHIRVSVQLVEYSYK